MRTLLPIVAIGLFAAPVPSQEPPPQAPANADAVRAVEEWVADYERARIGPNGRVRRGADQQPTYIVWAQNAKVLTNEDEDRLTHREVLQKLLTAVRAQPSTEGARSMLALAAVGLESSFLSPSSLELRELGHTTLLQTTDDTTWLLLLRAAAGERAALFGEHVPADDEAPVVVGSGRRVAALRLLAARNLPSFRSTIDSALNDPEPPVRLAAAEALEAQGRADVVPRVAAALVKERHPVVSQALVHLLASLLHTAGATIEPAARESFVAAALQKFGQIGWRTDMELLDLVEAWPSKDAIPVLIEGLDLAVKSPDALVTAINKRASPLLRQRAAGLLRSMTGALLPADDPAAWREFWQREKDNLVVPTPLHPSRPDATRATFFGLPVAGASIAFVIDTSGSMDENPSEPDTNSTKRNREDSRLRAAKDQLVAAVQVMPPESQYIVVTFADAAHTWTAAPVKPGPATTRSLTELLGKLRARGGTNLHDGLVAALGIGEQRFGQPTPAKVDEIFVLSDGESTVGQVRTDDQLLAIVREANKYSKVRINTVFTGRGLGADLLRRLAEENGGVFVQR